MNDLLRVTFTTVFLSAGCQTMVYVLPENHWFLYTIPNACFAIAVIIIYSTKRHKGQGEGK